MKRIRASPEPPGSLRGRRVIVFLVCRGPGHQAVLHMASGMNGLIRFSSYTPLERSA
jgi:hypothetical protein